MDSKKSLAASLAATYVMYYERGDNTRALQAQYDAVIRYALVTPKQWAGLVKAEQRAAARDRAAIDRKLAASGR
jgi:hypothetical protein